MTNNQILHIRRILIKSVKFVCVLGNCLLNYACITETDRSVDACSWFFFFIYFIQTKSTWSTPSEYITRFEVLWTYVVNKKEKIALSLYITRIHREYQNIDNWHNVCVNDISKMDKNDGDFIYRLHLAKLVMHIFLYLMSRSFGCSFSKASTKIVETNFIFSNKWCLQSYSSTTIAMKLE